MARKKQWPPRPHPHRASGQERVRIGTRDYYLGPIGSEKARRNYAELIARLADRPADEPVLSRKRELTVAEVVERHRLDAQARYSREGREASQFRWAAEPLLHLFAELPVARLGVQQLDSVRDEMIRRGWSRGVINRRIIRLRTLWRWAEQKGLAPPGSWNALRALAPLPRNDQRVKTLPARQPCTWADLARVCRLANPTIRAMLVFGWFTGARPGEIRSLTVGDIDTSGEVWLATLGKHKNAHRGQVRVVAVGPRCQGVLRRFLEGKKPDEPVFPSGPGRHYSSESFSRAVARARQRAGVEGLHPYQSRHAYKQRVTRELGLDFARAGLGQANLSTTDKYAAGGDLTLAIEAAKRCG